MEGTFKSLRNCFGNYLLHKQKSVCTSMISFHFLCTLLEEIYFFGLDLSQIFEKINRFRELFHTMFCQKTHVLDWVQH